MEHSAALDDHCEIGRSGFSTAVVWSREEERQAAVESFRVPIRECTVREAEILECSDEARMSLASQSASQRQHAAE
jgi:hypothetical protein